MKLFFDSGATKCDCILLDEGGCYIEHFTDVGINATYTSDQDIDDILARFSSLLKQKEISEITFSGAGCGNPNNAARLERFICKNFGEPKVEVISDLVGACRLLSPDEEGLVAILGTGASACRYDGKQIVKQAPSLGYLLGDEGSGTYIGKLFIQKYLRDELPLSLQNNFEREFAINKQTVIRQIYQMPKPNLYLSSFARYIHSQKEELVIRQLLHTAFKDFFEQQINYIQEKDTETLHLMGSIGYHYREVIEETAFSFGIKIGKVASSPLNHFTENRL